MLIDGIDVCQNDSYDKFKEFIENEIPLQTWIEPISYLDWQGLVNEVSDQDYNDQGGFTRAIHACKNDVKNIFFSDCIVFVKLLVLLR